MELLLEHSFRELPSELIANNFGVGKALEWDFVDRVSRLGMLAVLVRLGCYNKIPQTG